MRINKTITAAALMAVALMATTPAMLQAQNTPKEWTLRQCIEHALEHNLTIQRAEVVVEQYETDVNTAKWLRLPNLNGSASQNFSWGRGISPDDNTYKTLNNSATGFSLSTNVPLFTGMQIPNQQKLAQLNLKAFVEDLNKAKDDIAIAIASYYVQVLYNQELATIAAEQVDLSRTQLERIARLKELGKASPAEVSEVKARLAQDEMSAVQAENNYGLSLLNLSQLLELPTPEGFAIATPDVDATFAALTPPDDIFQTAVASKPGILAAQYRLEGAEKSIRIAQSAYYPQLSLGAGISSQYYMLDGKAESGFFDQLDKNRQTYIGFNLSIPIFNRFSTRNRVRNARLQQSNYNIQLDEAKKELYKEIQQAWYNAVAAESKFNSSFAAVNANQEAFDLMTEKYHNGKATSIEFSEAKFNLMKSLSDNVQAKYDYLFCTKVLDFYKGIEIQ